MMEEGLCPVLQGPAVIGDLGVLWLEWFWQYQEVVMAMATGVPCSETAISELHPAVSGQQPWKADSVQNMLAK